MVGLLDLPNEIILKVMVGLGGSVLDLTAVQLVCQKFHELARDGSLWRDLCFEGSIAGRRHNRATIPKTIPPRQVQVLQAEAAAITSSALENSLKQSAENANESRRSTRAQELAKWSPPDGDAEFNWYREYVARVGPVHVQWVYQDKRSVQEIEGVALHRSSDGAQQAIARFDDGRVGLWAFDGGQATQKRSGFIQSQQPILQSGYGTQYDGIVNDQAAMSANAVTDCIAVDTNRHKAYVAVDCQLNEVDLRTLQQSSCSAFPRPISALSNMPSDAPLIVGTSSGLYRHDHRVPPRWFDGVQALSHQQSIQQPGLAPGPHLSLAILQADTSNYMSGSSAIYAAGRFPSILMYDQRTFPKVTQSIWSGADLSNLSMLDHVLPHIPRDGDLLSNTTGTFAMPSRGHTILAGGAKNGKGSLEMYGIDLDTNEHYGSIRNRTMASRTKLLSVIPHGKRICASDADGNIKWFERDGFNLVRQINTNDLLPKSSTSPSSSPGLFGARQDSGDVVQKILPTCNEENADLLIWAGNRAGILKVGRPAETVEPEEQLEASAARARKYEEDMRRLLEAQAMETRRIQNFGME